MGIRSTIMMVTSKATTAGMARRLSTTATGRNPTTTTQTTATTTIARTIGTTITTTTRTIRTIRTVVVVIVTATGITMATVATRMATATAMEIIQTKFGGSKFEVEVEDVGAVVVSESPAGKNVETMA
jgi:hypothetical protein